MDKQANVPRSQSVRQPTGCKAPRHIGTCSANAVSVHSAEQRSVGDEPVLGTGCQMWGVSQRIERSMCWTHELLRRAAVSLTYPSNNTDMSAVLYCMSLTIFSASWWVENVFLHASKISSPVICKRSLFFFPLTCWHTQDKVRQHTSLTASETVHTSEVPWGNTLRKHTFHTMSGWNVPMRLVFHELLVFNVKSQTVRVHRAMPPLYYRRSHNAVSRQVLFNSGTFKLGKPAYLQKSLFSLLSVIRAIDCPLNCRSICA